MNNLAETVWHESPVILGAIAGSGKFKMRIDKDTIKDIVGYTSDENSFLTSYIGTWEGRTEYEVQDCTLITRSIDSLTDSEIDEIPSTKDLVDTELRPISIETKKKWLKEEIETNELRALDMFYLLFIGIWTGSPKNTEVIK